MVPVFLSAQCEARSSLVPPVMALDGASHRAQRPPHRAHSRSSTPSSSCSAAAVRYTLHTSPACPTLVAQHRQHHGLLRGGWLRGAQTDHRTRQIRWSRTSAPAQNASTGWNATSKKRIQMLQAKQTTSPSEAAQRRDGWKSSPSTLYLQPGVSSSFCATRPRRPACGARPRASSYTLAVVCFLVCNRDPALRLTLARDTRHGCLSPSAHSSRPWIVVPATFSSKPPRAVGRRGTGSHPWEHSPPSCAQQGEGETTNQVSSRPGKAWCPRLLVGEVSPPTPEASQQSCQGPTLRCTKLSTFVFCALKSGPSKEKWIRELFLCLPLSVSGAGAGAPAGVVHDVEGARHAL